MNNFLLPGLTPNVDGHCMYAFHTYASEEYASIQESNIPLAITFLVATVFALVIITFVAYDLFVQQRNNVSSLDKACMVSQLV